MTIHAGPYIARTIRDNVFWAEKYRRDAADLEAKAAECRRAADEAELKAAKMAEGTDFRQFRVTITTTISS